MANPLKGEVAFQVEGESYTLVFAVNAICQMEAALDLSVSEIAAELDLGLNVTFLRTVFWAALLQHHGVDLTRAGELMTAFGVKPSAKLIIEAFRLAFPQEDASAPARPPKAKARAGTG